VSTINSYFAQTNIDYVALRDAPNLYNVSNKVARQSNTLRRLLRGYGSDNTCVLISEKPYSETIFMQTGLAINPAHRAETMVEEYQLSMPHHPNAHALILQRSVFWGVTGYWVTYNTNNAIQVAAPNDFYAIVGFRQLLDILRCNRLDAPSTDPGSDTGGVTCCTLATFPGYLSHQTWRLLDAESEGEYGDCFWTFGSLQQAMQKASDQRMPYVTCVVRCWMVGDSLIPHGSAYKGDKGPKQMHISPLSIVPQSMWLIYHRSLHGSFRKGMDYVAHADLTLSNPDLYNQATVAEARPIRRTFISIEHDKYFGDNKEWVQFSRLSLFLPKVDYARLGLLCRKNATVHSVKQLLEEIKRVFPQSD
jgi:hypothetical protein